MHRENRELYIGIGIETVFGILGRHLEVMPLGAEIAGYSIGGMFIALGVKGITFRELGNRIRKRATNSVYISALPIFGRRQFDFEHEHLMWAELRVKNISTTMTLNDVEVQIIDCLYVMPSQSARGSYVIVDSYPNWNPTGVYWSKRNTSPSQFKLSLSPDATKTVLIAFQDNSNGGVAVFNAPTHPWITGGAKIGVEITSPNSPIWRGSFYIECHPNYLSGPQATFEFVEWDKWEAEHNIIKLSNPLTEGSQTE